MTRIEAPDPPPFFSIIMNVFNGEPFLRAAIDSILAQTYTDWELIIWDDQSADGSAALCKSYVGSRIRYVLAEEHVPISIAREKAIKLARAPWVAFLDQDDIWLPQKLAAQAGLINADQTGTLGLVYGRTEAFDLRGRYYPFDRWHGSRNLPEGDIATRLLERPSFISLSSVVLRRDAMIALGPMPDHVRYCPDYFLCVGVAQSYHAACLQDLCCLYRVHATNMSWRFRGEIHAEILDIIRRAAGPGHGAILRRRRLVHETWIGVDEIVTGKGRRRGLRRIVEHGSMAYLAGRPALIIGRNVMNRLASRQWKYLALQQVRTLGLLGIADKLKFSVAQVRIRARNQQFRQENPSFTVPPADLAFDAFNSLDWRAYRDGGRRHATAYADIIRQNAPPAESLKILEWGCGPGRVIRHMPELLADRHPELTGADYNPRSIAWCKANLPGITFIDNGLMPPLSLPSETFDVTYNFSVFTHLSAPVQVAWAKELWRVLKPGGLLVCSTHGDHYRYLLATANEQARYDAGEIVTQARYDEGRKWFFAMHPPSYVRNVLLADFEDVQAVPLSRDTRILHDIWIARKKAR